MLRHRDVADIRVVRGVSFRVILPARFFFFCDDDGTRPRPRRYLRCVPRIDLLFWTGVAFLPGSLLVPPPPIAVVVGRFIFTSSDTLPRLSPPPPFIFLPPQEERRR